jgi:hypothetical protein
MTILCDQFISDLRQVGGFLVVLRFPPPIKHAESPGGHFVDEKCKIFCGSRTAPGGGKDASPFTPENKILWDVKYNIELSDQVAFRLDDDVCFVLGQHAFVYKF